MDATDRRDRVSEEAADWWARLQGDDLARADREQFIDWLRESQLHVAEMLHLIRVHGTLEQFQRWERISTEGTGGGAEIISIPSTLSPSRTRVGKPKLGRLPRIRPLAVAASLAVAVLSGVFFLSDWRGRVIETERGERREVVLEDGSSLQVDPKTRLRIQFDDEARRVVLETGRAVFRVAKNPKRPFLVLSNDTTVRAVGTAFGVDRHDRSLVVVTVAEGKVAVSHKSKLLAGSPEGSSADVSKTETSSRGAIYLTQNQQLAVRGAVADSPVRIVDSNRELAWAEGRLIFKSDAVEKVVSEFNRYNRVQIRVTDGTLASRPVSGVFDAANPEAFVSFIEGTTSVQIERIEGREIIISSRRSH